MYRMCLIMYGGNKIWCRIENQWEKRTGCDSVSDSHFQKGTDSESRGSTPPETDCWHETSLWYMCDAVCGISHTLSSFLPSQFNKQLNKTPATTSFCSIRSNKWPTVYFFSGRMVIVLPFGGFRFEAWFTNNAHASQDQAVSSLRVSSTRRLVIFRSWGITCYNPWDTNDSVCHTCAINYL